MEEGIVPMLKREKQRLCIGHHAAISPAMLPKVAGISHPTVRLLLPGASNCLVLGSSETANTDSCLACAAIVYSSSPSAWHVPINKETVGFSMAELFSTSLAKGVLVAFTNSLLFVKHRVSTNTSVLHAHARRGSWYIFSSKTG